MASGAPQGAEEIDQGAEIGQGGGDGRADNLPTGGKQHEHEKGIQGDVQHAAQHDAGAGLERAAFRPDQMGKEGAHGGGQTAEGDGDHQIIPGVAVYLRRTAAEPVDEQIRKDPGEGGITQGEQDAAPGGEGGNLPHGGGIPDAQCPGNDAGAADAEEIGNGGKEHEGGHANGCGGQLGVAAGHANEESVRHVVDDEDNLAHDGGEGQTENSLKDWAVFKGFFFILSHGEASPFVQK